MESNTCRSRTDELIRHRSGFYQSVPGSSWVNAPYVDNSYKWAGGGYLSTPADIVRFGMALMTDLLLDSAAVAQMWTRQVKTDGEQSEYGIGFFISEDFDGRRVVGHGGGSIGGMPS